MTTFKNNAKRDYSSLRSFLQKGCHLTAYLMNRTWAYTLGCPLFLLAWVLSVSFSVWLEWFFTALSGIDRMYAIYCEIM